MKSLDEESVTAVAKFDIEAVISIWSSKVSKLLEVKTLQQSIVINHSVLIHSINLYHYFYIILRSIHTVLNTYKNTSLNHYSFCVQNIIRQCMAFSVKILFYIICATFIDRF